MQSSIVFLAAMHGIYSPEFLLQSPVVKLISILEYETLRIQKIHVQFDWVTCPKF